MNIYIGLQSLLEKGAKYVVVQGLPLTGCLPLAMSLAPEDDRDNIGCVKSVNNQSYIHNAVLQAKLQELRKQFPNAVITYADYWNAYRTVMKSPSQYGFKELFSCCCGKGEPYNFDVFTTCGMANVSACANPSKYINWDGVHLTEAMYKVVSNMFLNGTFSHPPFSYLLGRKIKQGWPICHYIMFSIVILIVELWVGNMCDKIHMIILCYKFYLFIYNWWPLQTLENI